MSKETNTKPKRVKKSKNVVKLVTQKRKDGEAAFMADVIDIVEDVKEFGDIKGYVILTVYKDGVNCRHSIPDFVPDHLYPAYTADVLREYMRDTSD